MVSDHQSVIDGMFFYL